MSSAIIISKREEDARPIRAALPADFLIKTEPDVDTALVSFGNTIFDFVFLDCDGHHCGFSQTDPLATLSHFRELNPLVGIVLLCSKENIREIVQLIKFGADDYLTYPIDLAEVRLVVESLSLSITQNQELDYLRDRFWKSEWLERVQTRTDSMRAVYKKIRSVAPTKATVLLVGETGTGKTMLAKMLHRHSNRCDGPFVSVHCGAIPDTLIESELFGHEKGAFTGADRRKMGRFELARTGTIFLDEIGTIAPALQVKLLQILQDGVFSRVGGEAELLSDARVIAATNADLSELTERGKFRKDLFYRLNLFPMEVPPLRQRRQDIPYFIEQILKRLNQRHGKNIDRVHPIVVKALQGYDWPGNIRELENLMERAYILEETPMLTPDNFPGEIVASSESGAILPLGDDLPLAAARAQSTEVFERQYLNALLSRTGGRMKPAAEKAGISTRQLNKLMVKHGIRKETFKK